MKAIALLYQFVLVHFSFSAQLIKTSSNDITASVHTLLNGLSSCTCSKKCRDQPNCYLWCKDDNEDCYLVTAVMAPSHVSLEKELSCYTNIPPIIPATTVITSSPFAGSDPDILLRKTYNNLQSDVCVALSNADIAYVRLMFPEDIYVAKITVIGPGANADTVFSGTEIWASIEPPETEGVVGFDLIHTIPVQLSIPYESVTVKLRPVRSMRNLAFVKRSSSMTICSVQVYEF